VEEKREKEEERREKSTLTTWNLEEEEWTKFWVSTKMPQWTPSYKVNMRTKKAKRPEREKREEVDLANDDGASAGRAASAIVEVGSSKAALVLVTIESVVDDLHDKTICHHQENEE